MASSCCFGPVAGVRGKERWVCQGTWEVREKQKGQVPYISSKEKPQWHNYLSLASPTKGSRIRG